jgi:hypothetical protein
MSKSRFHFSVKDGQHAVLKGEIDEFAELPRLAAALTGPELVLDLGLVERINSVGIGMWTKMLEALGARPLTLRRCPPVMVEQLNLVRKFRGNARVASVLLPFACPKCRTMQLPELDLAQYRPDDPLPEGPKCSTCGGPTEFDDLVNRYLGFLRYRT